MYTYQIEQAIKAAAILHHDQYRKGGTTLPYITHLMSVALLIQDYTDDEDTICAALLHDTIEDTDYTLAELEEDFGERVRVLVETVTERYTAPDGTKYHWVARKQAYAEQLRQGPIEAVMIAAADKIHNFRSTVEEYYDAPDRFLQDFGKHLDDRLEAYGAIATVIESRLEGPLCEEFTHVFTAYKQFIYDIQNPTEATV